MSLTIFATLAFARIRDERVRNEASMMRGHRYLQPAAPGPAPDSDMAGGALPTLAPDSAQWADDSVADQLRMAAAAHADAATAIQQAASALKDTAMQLRDGARQVAQVGMEEDALKSAIRDHVRGAEGEMDRLEASLAPQEEMQAAIASATAAAAPAAVVAPPPSAAPIAAAPQQPPPPVAVAPIAPFQQVPAALPPPPFPIAPLAGVAPAAAMPAAPGTPPRGALAMAAPAPAAVVPAAPAASLFSISQLTQRLGLDWRSAVERIER